MEKNKLRDTEWMYNRLCEYAKENNLKNTLTALPFAKKIYENAKPRRDGEPYFIHPLAVTLRGIALGITDDISIATELLHDSKEECPDCDLDNLNIEDVIKKYTYILTYTPIEGLSKIESQKIYYSKVREHLVTTKTKALDRVDNVSTMGWSFKLEKLHAYVEETYRFYPDLFEYWLMNAKDTTEKLQIWEIQRTTFAFLFSTERFIEPVDEELKRNLEKMNIAS